MIFLRYSEIQDMYMKYKGKTHYYIVKFAQKPGQLKKFMSVLCEGDDIIRFEYLKRTNNDFGNVLIGIEVNKLENVYIINAKLKMNNFNYIKLSDKDSLYSYLI